MKTRISIIIDEHRLSRIGTASLTGMVMKEVLRTGIRYGDISEVELIFPQMDQDWIRKNGGPKDIIIYEHNVPCLIDCIVKLQEDGIKVVMKCVFV